jgi:hypothetical protein
MEALNRSILALSLALLEGTGVLAGIDLVPSWSGAFLALSVISSGFSYSYFKRTRESRKTLARRVVSTDE